jgi:potassium-transporting ATPase KdpC subunit
MLQEIRPALVIFTLLTLVTGVVYPGVITLIGTAFFRSEATGSILTSGDRRVGSRLLGQTFTGPGYFWGRPSATAPQAYNGAASSGSNQATTNPGLTTAVAARVAVLRAADPGNREPVPVDLVTASGSGLDPHISPAGAAWQVARVARSRGLQEPQVQQLVAAATEQRTFGLLGEPRVNVLELNLALDNLR